MNRDGQLAMLRAEPKGWNDWRKKAGRMQVDLTGADLRGLVAHNVNLAWCQLADADFRGSSLAGADLSGANLEASDLRAVSCRDANFLGANLASARLDSSDFSGSDFRGAHLEKATAVGARFDAAVFSDVTGAVAVLTDADFSRAALTGAVLSAVDCSRVRLRSAALQEVSLKGAVLQRADLHEANLTEARLDWADCRQVDLSRAVLVGARFRHADLRHANVNQSDLRDAVLVETQLETTECSQAIMGRTTFAAVDLCELRGLATVVHRGPSIVSLESILRAGKCLPDEFLEGVGVPRSLLGQLRASAGLQSCFISYSTADDLFARRLYEDLRSRGVAAWFFPEDAKIGEPLWREISGGIMRCDKLIVVCSQHSLQSEPVLREIERAFQREDTERRTVLCPIRIDDYVFRGWRHHRHADLVARVVGDFSLWNTNAAAYALALERLLATLEPNGGSATS